MVPPASGTCSVAPDPSSHTRLVPSLASTWVNPFVPVVWATIHDWHDPDEQEFGCTQLWPHMPQLALSFDSLTHVPLQELGKLLEHLQVPAPSQVMFVPHTVPELAGGLLQVWLLGPVDVQVPAVWHGSDAGQLTAVPAHMPVLLQVSPVVQPLPSLQDAPVATGLEHAPVLVLHVPAVWHWSRAVQVTGFDPTHIPLELQVSVCVQALPSLHDAPVATGLEHVPVDGLQVPAVWH